MIIKEIYIGGFGCLTDFRKSFSPSLNTVVEENGFGKSTMMAFMRAMLFGIDDTRSTRLDENPRRKYEPWSGGAFGGWMSFDLSGRHYRAERSFGKKASGDTFTLIDLDTGTRVNDFSERLGEEIFGIDADGFERTVFLSERNLSGKNTNPTIAAKLSNITFAEGDIGGFDDAIKLLDDRRRFYQKRGGAGEIQDTENEISITEDRLAELRRKRIKLASYEQRLGDIETELAKTKRSTAELKRRIGDTALLREREAHMAHYREMRDSMRGDEQELSALASFFERELPDEQALFEAKERHSKITRLQNEIGELSEKARDGIEARPLLPDESECAKIRELTEKIKLWKSNNACARTDNEGYSSDISESGVCGERYAEYTARGRAMPKTSYLISGIGIAIAVIGFMLASAVTPLMFILAFCGFLLTIVGILGVVRAKKAAKANKKSDEYRALNEELIEVLLRFTDGAESDPLFAAESLLQRKEREEILSSIRGEDERRVRSLEERLGELISAENEFLSAYPTVSGDPISEIIENRTKYATLMRSLSGRREALSRFGEAHGIVADAPPRAEYTKEQAGELEARLASLESEALALERERARIDSEYAHTAEDVDKAEEEEQRLCELYERRERYNDNLAIITKTKELLAAAKESLTTRYLERARAAFAKYMQLIGTGADDLMLDTAFTVTKADLGASRTSEAYSRGTRDLFSLAVRLALCDVLYEGESIPPLWLDDPFSAFDDSRLADALSAVRRLAKTRQIFYFTCTRTRKI